MYDKYLMGRDFTLYTDHKFLVRVFDSKQATSTTRQLEFNNGF